MTESPDRKPSQSAVLLLGMLLTLLAVIGHRFLPERRLTINNLREGYQFFPVESGNPVNAEFRWIDAPRFHYAFDFPQAAVLQGCGIGYMLAGGDPAQGVDLSHFHTLNLAIRYTGKSQYLRIGIRNFDPRFSTVEDLNSPKFNFVNIPVKDLAQPIAINMSEFAVAEWWTTSYDLPRKYSRPDLTNATVFNIDLQGELAGTKHDIQIDQIEFTGDWISAEYWYLGILCLWMLFITTYGVSEWVRLRRKHREQRQRISDLESEKEKYLHLSTIDALTNVPNRHGIERYIEELQATLASASVIVIDIDHFKRVNDQRGHYGGDRVLRKMGEILRAQTRGTDGLGRWGGEEFVLVCPGLSLDKAAELAEKLRKKIMETNFIPDDPLPITASFGVATARAGTSFDDAFQQADEALYLAKGRGRNCVVAAAGDEMHTMTGARKSTWAKVTGRFKLHH